jgi:hypothetical protein
MLPPKGWWLAALQAPESARCHWATGPDYREPATLAVAAMTCTGVPPKRCYWATGPDHNDAAALAAAGVAALR